MNKEEILKKHGLQIGFKSTYSWDSIIDAMQEYSNQQNAELTKQLKQAKAELKELYDMFDDPEKMGEFLAGY